MVKNTKKVSTAKKTAKVKTVASKSTKSKGVKKLFGIDRKFIVGALFIVLAAVVVTLKWLPALAVESILWTSGNPVTVSSQNLGSATDWKSACASKVHGAVRQVTLLTADPTTKTDCILGVHGATTYYTYAGQAAVGIQPAGESVVYRTTAACSPSCVYYPDRDLLVRVESNNSYATGRVALYNNLTSRLTRVDQGGGDIFYSFDASNPELISDYGSQPGSVGLVKTVQRSSNEQWLVMDFANAGLFRFDLNTTPRQAMKFSDWQPNYAYSAPSIEFDISDDGQHVAVFGTNAPNSIYDLTSTCGNKTTSLTADFVLAHQAVSCPELNLLTLASSGAIPSLSTAYQPVFNANGGELVYYGVSSDGTTSYLVTLRAANYNPTPTPTPTPPPAALPTSKDDCKDGGWKTFGTRFKNQGSCVSFVSTGKG